MKEEEIEGGRDGKDKGMGRKGWGRGKDGKEEGIREDGIVVRGRSNCDDGKAGS